MKSYKLFVIPILLLIFSGCAYKNSLKPLERDISILEPPGFIDVGIGFGRVYDTQGGNVGDDDASGIALSINAYPGGRWYGLPKKTKLDGINESGINLIGTIHSIHIGAIDMDTPNKVSNSNNIAVDTKQSVINLINNPEIYLHFDDRKLLYKSVDGNSKITEKERERLAQLAITKLITDDWHIVKNRNELLHRISIFYARSLSDFNNGGLKSEVNAVGFAVDVSPEMAIQFGTAFYDVDDGGGRIDSDSSFFFGISLNLFAFDLLSGFSNN